MKRVLKCFLFFSIFLLVGCGSEGMKEYTIELESNATTGYAWEYSFSKEGILKETKSEYVTLENTGEMVGVGGKQVFTFEGLKEGEVEINFIYKRSWEEENAEDQKKTYKLKVDNKLNVTLLSNN